MLRNSVFVISLLFLSHFLKAQPANDNCTDALELSIGESCELEPYTSIGATSEDESIAPNPSCGFFQGGDVWFSFEAPESGDFRVETSGSGTQWTLYSGACGSFTELDCRSGGVNYSESAWAGETLYLRIFRFNSIQGNDFDLCIHEIDIPDNDNCANATAIAVGETCAIEEFSSVFSTAEDESIAPNPNCGFFQGGDVWFSFEAPESGDFRVETSGSGTQWTLYSGACGSFTELDCRSGGVNYSESSWAGETLYLRVFRFNSIQGNDFDLCVHEIDIPANDNCANALDLALSDECEFSEFSSVYTTAESTDIAESPSCGFFQGGDVWFKFLSPASGQFSINLNNLSGTAVYTVYSGSCGSFEEISCSTNSESNFDDIELGGQILYIRVHRFNSIQGSDFELCVVATEVAPNNNCTSAIALEVGESCSFERYNNFSATSEAGIPNPGCGFFSGGDVWFSFTVPGDGKLSIQLNPPGNASFNGALYIGTCGNLMEYTCFTSSDDLVLNDPDLGGSEMLLRVFRSNSNIGSEFDICLSPTTDISGEISWNSDCGSRLGEITLYEAGTALLQGAYEVSVLSDGSFEVVTLRAGTFDLYIKVEGYLQRVVENISLSIGTNDVSFPSLIPGDISGNNSVGIQDFSAFSAAYGTSSGDDSYNALSDMNCDGEINIQDFSTFSSNYGQSGDAP